MKRILLSIAIIICLPISGKMKPAPNLQTISNCRCLAKAMYFEAGNQGKKGQLAVAWVVENRKNKRNHKNYCQTVYERRQFLFQRPILPKPEQEKEFNNWMQIQMLATEFLNHKYRYKDITRGAHYFHSDYVEPYWIPSKRRTVKIGRHIFYR